VARKPPSERLRSLTLLAEGAEVLADDHALLDDPTRLLNGVAGLLRLTDSMGPKNPSVGLLNCLGDIFDAATFLIQTYPKVRLRDAKQLNEALARARGLSAQVELNELKKQEGTNGR